MSFGIPLNPRLGCFFEGDSRVSGTTSNGSDPPGRYLSSHDLNSWNPGCTGVDMAGKPTACHGKRSAKGMSAWSVNMFISRLLTRARDTNANYFVQKSLHCKESRPASQAGLLSSTNHTPRASITSINMAVYTTLTFVTLIWFKERASLYILFGLQNLSRRYEYVIISLECDFSRHYREIYHYTSWAQIQGGGGGRGTCPPPPPPTILKMGDIISNVPPRI